MSDQDERRAVRNGEWRAAARLAYRRGDRANAVAYLAREGCEALHARYMAGDDRRNVWPCTPAAGVHHFVRQALAELVPGKWGGVARGTLLPRLPRTSAGEDVILKAIVRSIWMERMMPLGGRIAAWDSVA